MRVNKVASRKRKLNVVLAPGAPAEMWTLYVDGWTQDAIAAEYGVTQGRVSQVLAEYRADMPEQDKEEIRVVLSEQLRKATEAIMPRVHKGDIAAIGTLIKIQERIVRMYGLDVTPKLALEQSQQGVVRYVIEAGTEGEASAEDIIKALT